MVISKLSLSRRTMLRGMGAALALPLLDAMVPAATALENTAAKPTRRFGAVYAPNGAILEQWTPEVASDGFALKPSLEPLEPFRNKLVVVSNLMRAGTTAGDHAVSAAGWLTGVYAKRTEAEDIRANTTIDQIVAKQIGQDTPLPSLELATADFTGYVGACTVGFSCAYANTISWSSPTTPLPMEINPRAVFERLFGQPGTTAQRSARRNQERSVLDFVGEEAKRLKIGLGARDRTRLDQYLENIREIERRIQKTEARNSVDATPIDAPMGVPESFEEHLALMYDLLAIAYQADLTRVFTFMTDRELSQRTYPQIGVPEQHHGVSHHGNDPAKIVKVAKINRYHMELFAKFLTNLASTPDGDGSLLDHSLIFYGCGMGNPNQHATNPLPLVAIGGWAGKGNRHILLPERTPVGNMWLSVANRFGSPIETFGESNGKVDFF